MSNFDHSLSSETMAVVTIPALSDNNMYLIVCKKTGVAAVVDPVEPAKVIAAAKTAGASLQVVLTTHNHWDHAGGNEALASEVPGLIIYGGKGDRAAGVTKEVTEGDVLSIGALQVKVMDTKCHTPGHVSYLIDPADNVSPLSVFTGDTLFVSGCGNFNSGSPAQMASAFIKFGALPASTLVWVGHEYTTKNLEYALSLEPENKRIKEKYAWAKKQRSSSPPKPTVPSTIAEEAECNPFMRVSGAPVPSVMAKTGSTNPADAILWVRKDKDAFGRRGRR
jgi:hydroxyacylglutathione hydrolase